MYPEIRPPEKPLLRLIMLRNAITIHRLGQRFDETIKRMDKTLKRIKKLEEEHERNEMTVRARAKLFHNNNRKALSVICHN